jgi:hypothetical protein
MIFHSSNEKEDKPMFVQGIDNRLYLNPLIALDGAYIKIEGIETPEIIVAYKSKMTLKSSRALALKHLKSTLGSTKNFKLNPMGEENDFAFPPEWKGMKKGAGWPFTLLTKIPVPTQHEAMILCPTADVPYMAWELPFPFHTVFNFVKFGMFSSILTKFMTGKEMFEPISTKLQAKIAKEIINQHPDLTDLDKKQPKEIMIKKPKKLINPN